MGGAVLHAPRGAGALDASAAARLIALLVPLGLLGGWAGSWWNGREVRDLERKYGRKGR